MRKIRIFISSPGDVQQERNIARDVISDINKLYSRYANIQVLMWEDFPLTANSTFQEGINYFLENDVIDIAVFILWSRLGTPLCSKFRKPDGTPYQSGTEYEFDMMMSLFQKTGSPKIMTYVKNSRIKPSEDATIDDLLEARSQETALQSFLSEHFRDEDSNSNYAYLQFGGQASFEQKFRTHITHLIKSLIGDADDIKEWEGNPYVGLNSFDYNQSAIFYGRKNLVYETASKIVDGNDRSAKKSLIVLGESGSGKSSFVKAGIVPFFCKNTEEYSVINPSMFSGQIYNGILNLLGTKYSFLTSSPFFDELQAGIDESTNFKHLSYIFENNTYPDYLLFIDQFEELFSDPIITSEEKKRVLLLLKGIISTRKIMVVISMRSDFYNRFSMYNEMAQIKEQCIVTDMPVVGPAEMTDIVEEPARKACLKWEIDNAARGLNKTVIKDALEIRNLPLIEFALSELYNMRDENNYLTFSAYEKIGKLEGAIVTYAQNFYSRLNKNEKEAFDNILGYVITESTNQKGVYVRKTSLRSEIEKNDTYKVLLKKLIDAHLFISGKDSKGNPTITITHEILIKSWDIISKWVEKEKEFLERNAYYEQLAQHWVLTDRSSKALITGATPLLEAEYHLFKNTDRLSKDVKDMLTLSIRKDRRKGLIWRGIAFGSIFVSASSIFLLKILGTDSFMDSDFAEWTAIYSTPYWDLALLFSGILLMILQSIIIKASGKPVYKTNRYSIIGWAIVSALLSLDIILTHSDWGYTLIFGSIYAGVPLYMLASHCIEGWRRRKWQTAFVPYTFSDESKYKFKTTAIAIIVVMVSSLATIPYMGALYEKEERSEQRAAVADILFDGLDRIQKRLIYADIDYVNNIWREYLAENYEEDLIDAIGGSRELEYARCLYNLRDPETAQLFLYPDQQWSHHLMYIFCLYANGEYKNAEKYLDQFIKESWDLEDRKICYMEYGDKSTSNLIWISEKLGRFDLADELYGIIRDTLPARLSEPAQIINQAHIYLNNGNKEAALDVYNSIITDRNYNEAIRNQVKSDITKDFHTFSRFHIIPDEALASISNELGLKFNPAFTEIDSALTKEIHEKLIGDWQYIDEYGNTAMIQIDSLNMHLTTELRSANGNVQNRTLSECRFARHDGRILWDEFDLLTDDNYLCELMEISDDKFVIKAILSQLYSPEELYTYTRVEEPSGI